LTKINVDIKEFIQKMIDVKNWEEQNYKRTGNRRLPNYILLSNGKRVLRDNWLDAVKRYYEWMKKENKVPRYIEVEIVNDKKEDKKRWYYPTVLFKQDVGGGSFGHVWYPNRNKLHTGVDVDRNKIFQPVRSIGDGKVMVYSDNKDWDDCVIIEYEAVIDNKPKKFCATYWHLEKVTDKVKVKKNVKAGEQIGVIGRVDTNQITGPAHLHFSIWNDSYKPLAMKGALDPNQFPAKFIEPYKFLSKLGAVR